MVAEVLLLPSLQSPGAGNERAGRGAAAQEAARHDAALVERFKAGDDGAFDEIIARYHERISAFAFTVLRNHADAEEVAQDTFIRVHRSLHRFRGDCSLATWLHTVALNLSRNRYWYFSRRYRQTTLSLDCAMSEGNPDTFTDLAASDAPSPVGEAITREFSAVVEACIAKLAPHHREILERRILQSCTYEEIAETLRISVGTVKSRIARARENLRALMAIVCPEFSPHASPLGGCDTVRSSGWLRRG